MKQPNKITGANTGGPPRLPTRAYWTARIAQFWRQASTRMWPFKKSKPTLQQTFHVNDMTARYDTVLKYWVFVRCMKLSFAPLVFLALLTACATREEVPGKGTLLWMELKATWSTNENFQEFLAENKFQISPPKREEIAFIFDRFVEMAPEAKDAEWSPLCLMVADLAEKGYKDSRVIPIIRARYLDHELCQLTALLSLSAYEIEGVEDLVLTKAKQIISRQEQQLPVNTTYSEWGFMRVAAGDSDEWHGLMERALKLNNEDSHDMAEVHFHSRDHSE